jgi:segregation and condensation protein A
MEKREDKPEKEQKNSVKQEQIHDLLFNREIGWQEIIYDLINTEQLDPWDINIIILSDKYLEKISTIEEADFFVSSKVLLAASLLLRIKSEILLNRYIQSIDEILFGKKEQPKYSLERIELNEDIPELIPRSPLPRFRKVTLQELMESLNKAIITENRRIKREIVTKDSFRDAAFSLPKRRFSIKDKIIEVYRNLTEKFKDKEKNKVSYNEFVNNSKEEKILSFLPLLYLEEQKKVWLEQEKPFEEVYIWLKETFLRFNPDPYADLKTELEETESGMSDEEFEKYNEEDEEQEAEEVKQKQRKKK